MTKETQCAAIREHLARHGSITPMEALTLYGCMRLGARVWDLKRQGVAIRTRMETRRNGAGEYKRFARYEMEDGEPYPTTGCAGGPPFPVNGQGQETIGG